MKRADTSSPIEPIVCLAHRFEAIGNKYIFKPMGFSPISMKILQLLKENVQLTSGQLIEMTGATKSNLSQRLSFLEKERFITRNHTSDDNDKRKILIKITATGKERISDLEKRLTQAQISFEKKFSEKELTQHKAFFKKLSTILDEGECELEKIFKF